MEVWQTLKFIYDSQIEPFIELDMGVDNIINRFRADFLRGVTSIRASRGYTQLPKNSFELNFFADKDNVVPSFISRSYYESFVQVLEALFHAFVVKNSGSGKPNPWESFVALLFTFERTALTHSSRTVCGT